MPETTISFRTDHSGQFAHEDEVAVGLVPARSITVRARLLRPVSGVRLEGSLDVDARDGSPVNAPQRFVLSSGSRGWEEVGQFRVDFGGQRYRVRVFGAANPPVAYTDFEVRISVD